MLTGSLIFSCDSPRENWGYSRSSFSTCLSAHSSAKIRVPYRQPIWRPVLACLSNLEPFKSLECIINRFTASRGKTGCTSNDEKNRELHLWDDGYALQSEPAVKGRQIRHWEVQNEETAWKATSTENTSYLSTLQPKPLPYDLNNMDPWKSLNPAKWSQMFYPLGWLPHAWIRIYDENHSST